MKQHKWTDAENDFLRNAVKRHCLWRELHAELLELFDVDVTVNAVKTHCVHNGLTLGVPNKYSAYSEPEAEYVRNNAGKMTLQQIADGLTALTGRKCSKTAVGHYINDKLGIVPSGVHGNLADWEKPYNTKQKKTERKDLYGGYTYVKTDDVREWKSKQRVEYEKVHGNIAPGNIVVFLNRDRTDFRPENLYCTDRRIHGMMCINGWYSTDSRLTLTALRWCEHHFAIKKFMEGF